MSTTTPSDTGVGDDRPAGGTGIDADAFFTQLMDGRAGHVRPRPVDHR